jgi:ketosteroid isomerase-like protein
LKSDLVRLVALPIVCVVCACSAFAQVKNEVVSSSADPPSHPQSTSPSPALKIPGPQVQNLLLGSWAIKTEYAPSREMPNGGTGEGVEVWRRGPGGYSVIEEFHEKNTNGEISGFGPAWWDADLQGQRFVWCDSTNPRGCELSKSVAKWEGDRLVYREDREENGKRITHEEVFEGIMPVSFLQTLSEGPVGGELKRTITIRATKIPDESTKATETSPRETEAHGAKDKGHEAISSDARCLVEYAPRSKDEAELVQIERDWCEAAIERDVKKLDGIFAEDISWIEDTGFRNKEQVLHRYMTEIQDHLIQLRDVHIRVFGNVAVVSSHLHVQKTTAGKFTDSDHTSVNVFEKRAGRWQLVVE